LVPASNPGMACNKLWAVSVVGDNRTRYSSRVSRSGVAEMSTQEFERC